MKMLNINTLYMSTPFSKDFHRWRWDSPPFSQRRSGERRSYISAVLLHNNRVKR